MLYGGKRCVHTHTRVHRHPTPARAHTPSKTGQMSEVRWGRGGSTAVAALGSGWRLTCSSLAPGTSSTGIILAPRRKRADVFLKGGVRHNRNRGYKVI